MWKKRSKTLMLLLVLLTLYPVGSKAQEMLSLEEAIANCMQNNFDIKLGEKQVEMAAVNNSLGAAGFLPEVNAEAAYQERVENTNLEFVDGGGIQRDGALSTNLNAGIQANWYVFDGTKMFLSKNRLEALEKKSSLELKATINNTVSALINTYYQAVAEKQTLRLYQAQLELSEARYKLSQDRLKAGVASDLEVSQTAVDKNADQSAVMEQEILLKQVKTQLNRLMGKAIKHDYTLVDSMVISSDLTLEELEQKLAENPNLKSVEQDLSIAVIEKKETFADRLPKLALNGRYNYNESESEAGFLRSNQTDGVNYGATLALPIFNGFERNRQAQLNNIRISESKLNYEQELAQAEEQLIVQFERYDTYKKLLKMEQTNVKAAKESLDFALESYKLGGISGLDLREVQTASLRAKERLVAVKFMIKSAETELLRLTNQLVEGQ